MEIETIYQSLRDEMVRAMGYDMKTPSDFDKLADSIFCVTHVRLSSHTLKRFWGYLKSVNVRRSTLDVMARFIGCRSWEGFVEMKEGQASGDCHISLGDYLDVTSLPIGARIRISWNPNHCIVARYEGHGLLIVEESVNGELKFGDTFRCFRIVAHEPLVLTELRRPGIPQFCYVCGERYGVAYDTLK